MNGKDTLTVEVVAKDPAKATKIPAKAKERLRTESKNFLVNADDICRIIKACADSNIREIKVGDLFLAFGKVDQPSHTPLLTETKSEQSNQIAEEARHQEMGARLEEDLDHLKLTDPLAYEQYVSGDIEGAKAPYGNGAKPTF